MTALAVCLMFLGSSLLYLFLWQIPWWLKLGQPRAGRITKVVDWAFAALLFLVGISTGRFWSVVFGAALAIALWHLLWEAMPPLRRAGSQAALGVTLLMAGSLLWPAP